MTKITAETLKGRIPKPGDPSWEYQAIVRSDNEPFKNGKVTRWVLAEKNCYVTVQRPDGTVLPIFLVQGWNPICVIRVNETPVLSLLPTDPQASSSDNVQLWAMY